MDVSREGPDAVPEDERDALLTIAHGAVVTSGGVSGQRVLITTVEAVLARGLGPAAYGVYALAWRIAQLLAHLVPFGSVPAIQRFLPAFESEPTRRSSIVGLAYLTTAVVGLAMAIGLWVTAPWIDAQTLETESFVTTVRVFGLLVVLLGLVTIASAILRAVGSARGEVLFNKLLRPTARLIGATTALWLGYSVVGIAGALVVSMALLVAVAVPVASRGTGITPSLRGARREARRFYNHALPIALSGIGKVFQNRIDVLLVGALLTAVAAGIYNVVLVLIAIAWIPLISFNQLLPPVASDLYANDRMDLLNRVYGSVTRLLVTTVIPLLAILVVYGRSLLELFGPTYSQGYVPLVVYLGGVFVGSAVGATGWLLMMTDHQYIRMALDWVLAVLNTGLTYVFILQFGLVGAALGTSLAIAIQNGIQVLLLRKFEGLWPFDRTYLRPLGAGLVAMAVMWLLRVWLPGTSAVLVGSLGGVLAYLLTLHLVGIDPRDRLVVRELTARYRARIGGLVSG